MPNKRLSDAVTPWVATKPSPGASVASRSRWMAAAFSATQEATSDQPASPAVSVRSKRSPACGNPSTSNASRTLDQAR